MPPSAETSLPPIRVRLPDGQEIVGQLYERRAWPLGGWMYLVGLPMWATDSVTERVEPREYRVWLTPDQAEPIDGASYDEVPTYPLPQGDSGGSAGSDRWGWKVQRLRPEHGRPAAVVVHIWDCPDAPADGAVVDVHMALDALRTGSGASACTACGASVALGPLVD